jgi:hypothetical protein
MAKKKAIKAKDRVSVTEGTQTFQGVVESIKKGIVYIDFDDGDEGDFAIDQVTLVEEGEQQVPPTPPESEKEKPAKTSEKGFKEALKDIDKIYVRLNADQKKIKDFKEQAARRLLLLEARLARYHNPKTGKHVPIEQFQQWNAEMKALKTARWVPGWKLPKRMTAYQKFMNE